MVQNTHEFYKIRQVAFCCHENMTPEITEIGTVQKYLEDLDFDAEPGTYLLGLSLGIYKIMNHEIIFYVTCYNVKSRSFYCFGLLRQHKCKLVHL